MPEVTLYDGSGNARGSVALSEAVFGITPNLALLHQAVVRQLADARRGTHDTKGRGEVSGSTRKMWRQKGTGRARQGSKRAPHWRHGGVVFGPHPRSYRQELPKKMRAGAIRSALAAKVAAGELVVVQELAFERPSTKAMLGLLNRIAPAGSRLLVLDAPQPAVRLSARNLPRVHTITTENINVYDLLRHERVVMSLGAVRVLEARYGGGTAEQAVSATTSEAGPAAEPVPAAAQSEGAGRTGTAAAAPRVAEPEEGASPDA